MEPTLEESLKQVLGTLPPVLRKYVLEERYTPVARELMGRYHLRVDQGGVLEREMLLLLIGVDTPDEFVASLASDAGLDEATIDGITRDVNERIFVPLRHEEMKQSPLTPAARATPSAMGAQNIEPAMPRVQRPMTPSQPKPLDAARLLEDHEEPHIDLRPRTAPPPPNLPGQMQRPFPPRVISPATRAPMAGGQNAAPQPAFRPAAPQMPPAPRPASVPPPITGPRQAPPPPPPPGRYSVDPYREPLDEGPEA